MSRHSLARDVYAWNDSGVMSFHDYMMNKLHCLFLVILSWVTWPKMHLFGFLGVVLNNIFRLFKTSEMTATIRLA